MRNIVSLFFSFIFLLLIAAPSLVLMVEDSFDISLIVDINEEENTEKESKKNLEVDVFQANALIETYIESETKSISEYYFRSHGKLYKKLHSPPPDRT